MKKFSVLSKTAKWRSSELRYEETWDEKIIINHLSIWYPKEQNILKYFKKKDSLCRPYTEHHTQTSVLDIRNICHVNKHYLEIEL